jgi:NAD(P)H-nitrite reductase large subunit
MKDWFNLSDDETVCYCINVNKQTIVNAIKNSDNRLSKIKESTKACTGKDCKTMNPSGKCCSTDIIELIKLYGKEDSSDESCSNSCCCG